MASNATWWSGFGGLAGVMASAQMGKSEKFDDETDAGIAAGVSLVLIIFAIYVVISILLVILAYKMFPDYKGLHALMTFLFGLVWLILAMLYYLFVLDGYHMKGIRIIK